MYTDAKYEPGTGANYLRIPFAVFSRGIPYSQTKDSNEKGKCFFYFVYEFILLLIQ